MTAAFRPPPFREFPVRTNCDPADPYQAFVWMLAPSPAPRKNPLRFPAAWWQLMSKRLWDLGLRPAAEPVLEYQPEPGIGLHCLFAAGSFVPLSPIPPPFPHPFPLRENCNPNNPYHAFVWMFVAPPGMYGAPLFLDVNELQLFSKQLWDLGARAVTEPTLTYARPTGDEPDWLTTPGRWTPVDEKAPA
jgi:hypothetical protein